MKTTVTYIRPCTYTKPKLNIGNIVVNCLLVGAMGSALAGLLLLLYSF